MAEVKDMSIEQLEERKTAIAAEIELDGADLDALENEIRSKYDNKVELTFIRGNQPVYYYIISVE